MTSPATAVFEVDETTTTVPARRHDEPPARPSTITAAGQAQPIRVTALASGEWSHQVDLRRGQNRFDINAVEPGDGQGVRDAARRS